jgi:hypothetical protein
MINQQLLDYVRAQRSAGLSKEAILQALAAGGWTQNDVTEAFMALDGVKTPPSPPPPPPPQTAAPLQPRVIIPPSGAAAPAEQPRPSLAPAEFSTAPVRRRSSFSFYLLLLVLLVFIGAGAAVYLKPSLLNAFAPYFQSFFPQITQDEVPEVVNTTPVNPLPIATSTNEGLATPQSTTTAATTTATTTKPTATSTKTR